MLGLPPSVRIHFATVLVDARVQDHPTAAIDKLLPGAWAAVRDEA